ncbi:MAG: biopolymer transporter ExbD [Armatimonadetes bacterium]|nr:biopolymer transporter ExbD [Akkermansiaceae bacterium]
MKLEMTLQERPGFLHAMPLFDLFALVTMLLMIGPMFLGQSGVMVDVPASQFQMQRYDEAVVVTLGRGEVKPRLYIGSKAVTLESLESELEKVRVEDSQIIVLLKTDVGVSVGLERKITELIIGMGFKLALVGNDDGDSYGVSPKEVKSDD